MMDDIKEEIEEFKLETNIDESVDVDGNNDVHLKLSLDDQRLKLEKQDSINELKDDILEIKDKEFELNSLTCVNEEIDTDSHSQVRTCLAIYLIYIFLFIFFFTL
ncbi:hypothetical protein C0J52_22046 [Blattella germanica]|nr:hypothetical protein C0J52_22046 [Blattella germanica]